MRYESALDWWKRVLFKTVIIMGIMTFYLALAGVVVVGLYQGVMFLNNKILHWGDLGLAFWLFLFILTIVSFVIAISEE